MNDLEFSLRRIAYWSLGHLPGSAGRDFERRLFWLERNVALKDTMDAFEKRMVEIDDKSICIDLGANVGEFTERFAKTGAQVYAFEPDPWAYEEVAARTKSYPNVKLFHAAIGANDGTLKMMREPGAEDDLKRTQGTSAFRSELWSAGEPQTFEIDCVDFCRFVREIGKPVDIVKVDIEGSEVELLEKLFHSPEFNLIRTMFVETHEWQMPTLKHRINGIRKQVRRLSKPQVYLGWQ